jgi:DNA-binding transcriptional regulator YiaG
MNTINHVNQEPLKRGDVGAMNEIILPAQIRAGRALLDLSQDQLAEAAQVGVSTLRDFESQRRSTAGDSLPALRRALENAGVVFLSSTPDHGPGVALAGRWPNIIRKPTRMNPYYQLPFVIEWRGRQVNVFLSREPLDDFARASHHLTDSEYVIIFEEHKAKILEAVARAIDAGRAEEDRLFLVSRDFSRQGGSNGEA